MKTMNKDHPRGVLVAICTARGKIIHYDPGAWARVEWKKHEKARRERRAKDTESEEQPCLKSSERSSRTHCSS